MKWIPIFRVWPKVTSRDENAGNTASFCVKVVTTNEQKTFLKILLNVSETFKCFEHVLKDVKKRLLLAGYGSAWHDAARIKRWVYQSDSSDLAA